MPKTTSNKKKSSKAGAASPKRASRSRSSGSKAASGVGKNLVIVESPAKAKTINRYLGSDYVVKASMGHVRDLPKSDIGVDIENGFKPTYEPLAGRKKVLAELKKYAKTAPLVFLATDLDREGEAIAWHLAESLNVEPERIRRVVFNEITSGAIREAFANPREIDGHMVNAQQARRILDRIVGYKISPLLWRKVAGGLSAGRVQSVAVRLIVDREREIDAFDPEEYWKIGAIFTPDLAGASAFADKWSALMATTDEKGNPPTRAVQQEFLTEHKAFRAELFSFNGKRFKCEDDKAAQDIAKALGLAIANVERTENPKGKGPARNVVVVGGKLADGGPDFIVSNPRHRESKSRPSAPFTTSTLQQTASIQLRFSAQRTMRTAQTLYEGMEVPGEGSVGLITYMRTDSTNLSNEAIGQVRSMIEESFGPDYLPDKPRRYSSRQRTQEAHEAVRPTDCRRRPEDLKNVLDEAQFKLYNLIWKRFVACQMNPAVWKVTDADIVAETPSGTASFKAVGRTLKFDGYMRVAGRPRGGEQILPELAEGQAVSPADLSPTQHFTQGPPRFTEASLVKALEADGIGRPSTYAAIIQTIQSRGYVEHLERSFHPTDLGTVVTDKLVKHFPKVLDIRFTAHMEDQLDLVEENQAEWATVLADFYGPFSENLELAKENMVHAKAEETPSDYVCEKCNSPMVYKFSKNGRYLACTGYPDCKNTFPVDKEGKKLEQITIDVACPLCEGAMIKRKGRFGPFLSCTKYPDCKGVVNLDRKGFVKHPSAPPLKVDLKCAKCEATLNLRRSKRGPWLSCSKYPKCRGRLGWKTLTEEQQKQLELDLLNHEAANPVAKLKTNTGEPIGDEHTPVAIDQPAKEDD